MLTVRDMVEVTGVRVLAGAGGLDRPVRWIHISELSPDREGVHAHRRRATMLQRAVAAHDRLERVALSEGGLAGLTKALGELVGGRAAVVDARGETLAGERPADGLELEVPGDSAARLVVHQP